MQGHILRGFKTDCGTHIQIIHKLVEIILKIRINKQADSYIMTKRRLVF